jgi:putative spermidine/putrescine transport system ATP-binding protein
MRGGPVLLQAKDIRKAYGSAVALDGISLDIAAGEFLTLLGPSGSGKTTFLMILGGFVAPSSGRLIQGNADITHLPPEQRRYGMVFQGYALFPHMTVEENIAFPLKVQRVAAAERRRLVDAMITAVGLEAHRAKRPAQLSGGQQQRVALARALVFRPEVLLLDEPLSALDKALREQMQGEIRRLQQQTGATFVFVTHDQTEALAMSSRIAIFNHGRLQQIGAPEAVYERPVNRFVAEFLGRINLFPIRDAAREGALLRGAFEDGTLAAPADPALNGRGAAIAVRPEYMSLVDTPPTAPGINAVAVRIAARQYGGASSLVQARTTGGIEIVLTLPSDAPAVPGARLWVQWPVMSGFVLPDGDRQH